MSKLSCCRTVDGLPANTSLTVFSGSTGLSGVPIDSVPADVTSTVLTDNWLLSTEEKWSRTSTRIHSSAGRGTTCVTVTVIPRGMTTLAPAVGTREDHVRESDQSPLRPAT